MPDGVLTPPQGGNSINNDLLERIRMLESLCENMKLEVASLKEENEKLKTQNNKDNKFE